MEYILSVVSPSQLQILAYMCGANLLLGIVAAVAQGEFEVVKLMDFWKRVAVTFGSYVAVSIAAKGLADFGPLREAIWVALMANLTAHILGNIKDLLGISLPESVERIIER